jgi:hypothetical protein
MGSDTLLAGRRGTCTSYFKDAAGNLLEIADSDFCLARLTVSGAA